MKAQKLSGIILPGTGYPLLNDFLFVPPPVLPVATGLAGLYTAGYSDAKTLTNYANAAKPLTKVGAPVVTSGAIGALTSRDNHYDTGLLSTADMTLMFIAKLVKPTADANGWLGISNLNQTGVKGADSIGHGFTTFPTAQVNAGTASNAIVLNATSDAAGTAGNYAVLFARIRNNGSSRVWWSQGGVVSSSADSAASTRFLAAVTLRLGGHLSVTSALFTAQNTILAAGIFQVALSDADVAANLAYLSATYGPSVGIATL